MNDFEKLPVAVIGAGPVGLSAAANLAERGIAFRIFEAGGSAGANLRDWGHVRVFTSWAQNVDGACSRLLKREGWTLPAASLPPTGNELFWQYLEPLSRTPEISAFLETGAKVVAISRRGRDKVLGRARSETPFELRVISEHGDERVVLARAVIDASGTWQNPNPLGASGLPAAGEPANAARIAYGMPDVLGAARGDYAGRSVAVVGAGYSAINVLLDLARLKREVPGTSMTWVVRGTNMARTYGGGSADQLAARGALGSSLRRLVEAGTVALVTGFSTTALRAGAQGLELVDGTGASERRLPPCERIIAATGQRPDLQMTRELRLDLDPALESTRALGPLIDPNLHSCGSVPPHGYMETSHPEPGFYTIGVKSYGRAPTFLLLTGYEQARSVVAAIDGDFAAAGKVELVLPETGICSDVAESGDACCSNPAPQSRLLGACGIAGAVAKAVDPGGCGCGSAL